jgi:Zinc carboxypeptidase
MRPNLILLFAWITVLSAAPALTPEELLPPAPPWSGASEALIAPADHPWITPAELSGMTDSPAYAETVAWLQRLAAASPLVRIITFGHTAQGRSLCAVIASREGIADAARLPASGRPTVLAQAGIHSGEIDGKDAGMMLLRDIAFGGKDALLDQANLLFIPVLNADGHERRSIWNRPNQRGPIHQGWRTTAQNINLNRDYMKAQAPEMNAVLKLIQEARPALYLDIHVTDGVDYQYDITYGFHGWGGSFAWSPQIGRWLDQTLRPALDADLSKAGHLPGPLVFAKNNRDLSQGILLKPYDPRFSTGYGDLRHLPTLLIENHSLKPFRQRVLGTYVLIETSLRIVGKHAEALKRAISEDEASRVAQLPLNWNRAADHQTPMDFAGIASERFDSPVSGIKEVRWLGKPTELKKMPVHCVTQPGITVKRPKAYYIPATKPEIIRLLKSHGIQMKALAEDIVLTLEHYRLVDPAASASPFEGRHTLVTKVRAESSSHTLPAGTLRVSTEQPLGDLAIALLEPEHLDSLAAWGFVPEILTRTEYIEGYVIAPLAERMMKDDPKLKSEFEAKLAADAAFAKDPEARLQWFYERSPFFDREYLRYPIGIER